MATYIVFTRESTQDQSELDIYQSKVRKPLKVTRSRFLLLTGRNRYSRDRRRRVS
jgi:hypothetical protein